MGQPSAIPGPYYAMFAFYEPALCILGFIGALVDPKSTHDMQAPWPSGSPPPGPLPAATFVAITQLGHVCALLGVLNYFVLTATRKYLASTPATQEHIVSALFTPLLFGDITHLALTFWALGGHSRDWRNWGLTLWTVVVTGLSLLIPRVCWHLGIGRYMDRRDGGRYMREAASVKS